MPLVLKPDVWPVWLGDEPADVVRIKSLLGPYPSDEMICWPISPRVDNVRNNDASLIADCRGRLTQIRITRNRRKRDPTPRR